MIPLNSMQNVRSYVLCKITHPLRKCVRPYVRPYGPSKLSSAHLIVNSKTVRDTTDL